MRTLFIIYLATIMLTLAGCGSPFPAITKEMSRDKAIWADDPYQKKHILHGVELCLDTYIPPDHFAWFETDFNRDLNSCSLIFNSKENNWSFYQRAWDIDGKQLDVFVETNQVVTYNCVLERISIPLTFDYLESHKETGLNIKLVGKFHSFIIKIPAVYISGYLERVNIEKEKL